ncbi:DnaJ-like protein subfamily C member 1 [Oryzias melastigma]|uniref:DnaJ homolog subfamily C member 1 n=1 Tax=Oryzias melastigma TaxID=30732 RepID=A0A3B3BA46_ORYME|nr:dnaJ homolog subfamily C member 1 [Oryzias melastigma]KAF6720401.1 DnaJ-like protein subfamily C member 1 [Oryzias melastigma]
MLALCSARFGPVLLGLSLLLSAPPPLTAWDADLELFDLVEEIPQTFYQFMNLDQDASGAEIKKAYRRLSLSLHPDKNKDENAETQFRQLVAIYEVLKDEERRRSYDDILVNGLPDWRQPVFYYRRVRKMSNAELGFLLFLILTVGHYAVIWSIYLEKQLDELLSKKKKDKKKKMNPRPVDDLRCIGQDQTDRNQERPHWQDILPLKLSIWLYLSVKNLPQTLQEVKQYYEDYQQKKRQQQEEEAASEQEAAPREKRAKVRKPKLEFPVYEIPADSLNYQMYDQTTSIEDIEDQMDDWLQDGKASKKKASGWTEEDMSLLSRLMGKFPGGSPGRWEKIAHELGRSVTDVTAKVKQMKDNVNHTPGLVKFSDLKGHHGKSLPVHDSAPGVGAELEQEETQKDGLPVRRRNKEGAEAKVRSRRQRDFDPNAVEKEEAEPQDNMEKSHASAWTQNQQKLLELALQQFPRGTAERWDRIAKVVPGKTKEECVSRYKVLAELIQKKKQMNS